MLLIMDVMQSDGEKKAPETGPKAHATLAEDLSSVSRAYVSELMAT